MTILITGAAGLNGTAAVHEFVGHGEPIRALVRNRARARELHAIPIVELVEGDMLLPQTLGPALDGVGRDGRPMRGDAVRQAFDRARRRAEMSGFRFHDLRHMGQTLAAATGATIKDLMRRLGHASPAASYWYLHAVDGRDGEITSALSELASHGDAAKLPRSIVVRR